jgi:hypothetical protein
MPDDSAALVPWRALSTRAAFLQPSHGLMNGPELLIVRHHLTRLAIYLLEDSEVTDQVKEVRWP